MTREQLDAIRARVEAATPGPWKAERWCSNNPSVAEAWGLNGMRTFADAVFCGHAREDVPTLLAEVERLNALGALLSADIQRLTRRVAENEADWLALRAEAATAFKRGVAAMREAVALAVLPSMSNVIRALPDPEDTE